MVCSPGPKITYRASNTHRFRSKARLARAFFWAYRHSNRRDKVEQGVLYVSLPFASVAHGCAELAAEVDLVVVAWGDLFAIRERTERVVEVLTGDGRILHCLGTTRGGNPRHPAARGRAMISSSQVPIPWKAQR
ncbi:DUF1643 domain-containing protein [Dyella sp. 2RAF44]|uniref:DUF1643 domain-containing protein n=1 Tax=Dyella sp. 2RAF44 TaxID=3233000 RepID=UPI003F90674A